MKLLRIFKRMIVKFKKFSDKAIIPTFGHDDDNNAGLDFYSVDNVRIPSKGSAVIQTDIGWQPILGYGETLFKAYLKLEPRSGLSVKSNIEVGAGIIDQTYRGKIAIHLYNFGDNPFYVKEGDRIAQGIVKLLPKFSLQEAKEIESSSRGEKGFGSSGV
jgi:dUTP pyrophosphatase